jgi:hypothetical protein
MYRQSKISVESIGRSGKKPLSVGRVLITKFKEGAHWRPRRLTPGRGALELMAHTVSARRSPVKALAALQKVVMHADVFKGTRGEASELIHDLLQTDGRKKRFVG